MRGEEDAYLAKRESEKVFLRGEGAGQNSTRCEVQHAKKAAKDARRMF